MTFWQRSKLFSPALIRLLARSKRYGAPISAVEIAQRSGLHRVMVEGISQNCDWESIDLPTMQLFTQACHFDFCATADMRRAEDYLRRKPSFRHLRTSPDWKSFYLPLMTTWRRSYPPVPPSDTWPPIRNLLVRLNYLLTTTCSNPTHP